MLRPMLVAIAVVIAASQISSAATFVRLHSFCSTIGCSDHDGEAPNDLVVGGDGSLYGTTEAGGAQTWGTVYRLSPGSGGTWTYKVLHSFCTARGCNAGAGPRGSVILDASGSIYGTTSVGGRGEGSVFKLTRTGNRWKEKTLYAFCIKAGCLDGNIPEVGLTYLGAASGQPYDGESPLYGTVRTGSANGTFKGAVFELTPTPQDRWSEKLIYSFCARAKCGDGATPVSSGKLWMDQAGNIYGTTQHGGDDDSGVLFQLSKKDGQWTQTVLHSFCAEHLCRDGGQPYSNPVMGHGGILFGATPFGGKNGHGMIYAVVPGATPLYSDLYDFCSRQFCQDGSYPSGGVTFGPSGDLYGTAQQGGDGNNGVVFHFGGKLEVLHSFCSGNCSEGFFPTGRVAVDAAGNIFATAPSGGSAEHGTAFEVVP